MTLTTSNKNKKLLLILSLTLLLTLLPIVNANPTIYNLEPNQNNELLKDYPTTIKYYIYDTNTIENCTINIDGITTNTKIGLNSIEINKEISLTEGTHQSNLTCTNTLGQNTNNTITFKTNDMNIFQESINKKFQLGFIVGISIILILVYINFNQKKKKDRTIKIFCMVGLLLCSLAILEIYKNDIIWIPIVLSTILVLKELFE